MKTTVDRTDYVDINHGLDYELSRESLNASAGKAWRAYILAKSQGAPAAKVDALRASYVAAQHAFKHLRAKSA